MNFSFCLSNIALPPYDHEFLFNDIKMLGFDALEIAPSRRWQETWHKLRANEVDLYRKEIEKAELSVCGLHSLFYDQPGLSIFSDQETKKATQEFLIHMSGLCRDLGGKTIIFGSPPARDKGDLTAENAFQKAGDFLSDLVHHIEPHGTVLCMEPLAASDSSFLNSVEESIQLTKIVASPALGVQIDLRAMVASNELSERALSDIGNSLSHVHVNASDLGVFQREDAIQCEKLFVLLNQFSYRGTVSLEQRMGDPEDILGPIKKSVSFMKGILSKHV